MNEQKKQKLLEQYDDAAFALLMDEYAEEEGARLMAEFEAAQAAGQVPEMPAELDEQCRRMIRRDRAKKRGIRAARSFRKVAVKAAVAVLVFIGLMTTVVMSVDALRVPVLSYLIEHFPQYSNIDFSTQPTGEPVEERHDPLPDLLPDGYHKVYYEVTNGLISSMYENDSADYVVFDMSFASGSFGFDTEDALCESIYLGDYEAILIKKDRLQVIWLDENVQVIYSFSASGLGEDEFMEICKYLASYYASNT